MKKVLLGMMVAFALTSTTGVLAQTATTTGKKPCYVDENNNKVCDKYESHICKTGNGTGAPDCRKSQAAKTTTKQATTKTTAKKTTK
jgi:hypothetical protein